MKLNARQTTLVMLIVAAIAAVSLSIAADTENLYGHTLTSITTNAVQYFIPSGAKDITIENDSATDYYIVINAGTNKMATLMATTNAYCVKANSARSFEDLKPPVTSFTVRTLTGTATGSVGGR